MARVSQTFAEPVVAGADEARVIGVLGTAAVGDNALARVAGVLGTAAVGDNALARVAGLLVSAAVADTNIVQTTSLYVEVFGVFSSPGGSLVTPLQGGQIQGAPTLGRTGLQGTQFKGPQ